MSVNSQSLPPPAPSLPKKLRLVLFVAIALQVVFFVFSAPQAFDIARQGFISPLTFFAVTLSSVFMATGGLLLWFKPRAATYIFGVTVLLITFALIQWRPVVAISGLALAVLACLATRYISKFTAKV